MKRVLILCTGNSCRSQMAEYLWRDLAGHLWEVDSAGSKPTGYVHPMATRVMEEIGVNMGTAHSKHVREFTNEIIDLVITVCDSAKETCPVLPGAAETLHWPFDDPADAEGSDEERLVVFRRVRDEIQERIRRYIETGD